MRPLLAAVAGSRGRRVALRPMLGGRGVKSRAFPIGIAATIFFADQLTNWLMIGPLQLQSVRQIPLLPFFNLTWTENRGISLGLLTADGDLGRWLLVGMTALIAGGIAWWITHEHKRGDQLALGMVLG